jgi:hypothetical protein
MDSGRDGRGRRVERWSSALGFTNIEHDVIPKDVQFLDLFGCPGEWCCFNEYDGGPSTFSLVRFRPGFIRANPDVWTLLAAQNRKTIFQPLWTVLDSWLVTHADRPPCVHESPHVVNVRPHGVLR